MEGISPHWGLQIMSSFSAFSTQPNSKLDDNKRRCAWYGSGSFRTYRYNVVQQAGPTILRSTQSNLPCYRLHSDTRKSSWMIYHTLSIRIMKYKRKKIRCYRDKHVCHTVVPVYAAFIILPTRYTYARFRCLDPRLHNQSTFNAGMFQVHVGTKPDNKQTVNTPKK